MSECDNYCKYFEQYHSEYHDPMDALEHLVNECCVNCPISNSEEEVK